MSGPLPGSDVPMTREELEETIASALCSHTRMSPAVQWEVDLLMGAVDRYVAYLGAQISVADQPRQDPPAEGDQVT